MLEDIFLGSKSAMDDSKSAIRESTLVASEGCRRDLGGLDRELALLWSLYPDAFEDEDSVAV